MRYLIPLLLSAPLFSQPVLRFKVAPPVTQVVQQGKPTSDAASSKDSGFAAAAATTGATTSGVGHIIVQFPDSPGADVIAQLQARGAKVLSDVPDNALLIFANVSVDLTGLGATFAGPLDASVKVSPLIDRASTATADYIVELHPDVDLNRGRSLILNLALNGGIELRENPDLGSGRLMVRLRSRLRGSNPLTALANVDEIAYIFPASQELTNGTPSLACAGPVTENGHLAAYVATMGNGWDGAGRNSAKLGYVFSAASSWLPAATAQSEIRRAMQEWSRVIDLSWQQGTSATASRTVNILFGKGAHGDGYPFDGRGNVLAHTFYPSAPNPEPLAGDMHLDDDEPWRVGVNVDLYSVALHELGHALGLGHSDDPNDVMYPYYRIQTNLQAGDINAILTLYAAAKANAPVTPTTPTVAPTTPTVTPTTPTTPTVTPTTPAVTPTTPTTPTLPSSADRTAPTLTIASPNTTSVTVATSTRLFSGTASDAGGVKSVTWTTATTSGSATLTTNGAATNWTATVPLLTGINQVTIRATDIAGNYSWRTIVVTRK